MEPEETVTVSQDTENKKSKKKTKKLNFLGCNNCHKTNVTLIKATDSYYCKDCFTKLGKQKFQKKRGK